jgi:hypothetical protein
MITSPTGRFTRRIGSDLDKRVYVELDDDGCARIHYTVWWIPSRRELLLRHFEDATPRDRRLAEERFNKPQFWRTIPADAIFEHEGHNSAGDPYRWLQAGLGHYIDDPCVQLELEMMIDAQRDRSVAS